MTIPSSDLSEIALGYSLAALASAKKRGSGTAKPTRSQQPKRAKRRQQKAARRRNRR